MIVVTGATGVIPQAIAKELTARGAKFRVLARDPSKVASGIEAIKGDLSDVSSLASAFAGADTLVLVTGAGPAMVSQHMNALTAAKAAGVKKVVRVSAWGANANGPIALGRWHAEIGEAFRKSGLAYVSLEPHGFMQNTLGYAGAVKSVASIFAPLGNGHVCYIDARDIGAVAAVAALDAKYDGQSLELTGPKAFSYNELASALSEVLEKPISYVNVPPEAAKASMLSGGWPEWLVDDLLQLSALYAADVASTPTETVAKVLGRPATSLKTFLTQHKSVFA